MTQPAKAPERVGYIVYKATEATGHCEVPQCAFTCRAVNEKMRLAVEDCRKSLQNHVLREHNRHVHEYYFDLIEEGRPYVK